MQMLTKAGLAVRVVVVVEAEITRKALMEGPLLKEVEVKSLAGLVRLLLTVAK